MSSFDEMDAFEAASAPATQPVAVGDGGGPAPCMDRLNPGQREAVEQPVGSVLMLAGTGTGKIMALAAHLPLTM